MEWAINEESHKFLMLLLREETRVAVEGKTFDEQVQNSTCLLLSTFTIIESVVVYISKKVQEEELQVAKKGKGKQGERKHIIHLIVPGICT